MATVQQLPSDVRRDVERQNWLDCAGVLLLLVGAFNVIWGIAAISNSNYLSDKLLFANLDAWGWFFLVWGVIQLVAGFAVMRGAGWAALVGIITTFANAVAQLSSSHTFVVWAILIVSLDVLIIYGLVEYGGDRGRAR